MTAKIDRALNLNIERPCLPTLCTPLRSASQPSSARDVESRTRSPAQPGSSKDTKVQFVIPTMSRPGEGACFPPRTRGLLVATAPAFRAPVRSR